jgi:hypothetical protein
MNLSLAEVTKSATAIKHGIANEPTQEHLQNLKLVAENVFQPIREHFGKPLAVSSGYRSKALNDLIGGSKSSQHSKGQALDLDADVFGGFTNADVFFFIKENLEFDQMIWEFGTNENPDWVHVSYKKAENRSEILIAYKDEVRRTRYRKW